MKKKIIEFSFLIIAVSVILSSYKQGPSLEERLDCTGAETGNGNAAGCTSARGDCHSSFPDDSITVALELDSAGTPVTSYVGGKKYIVKLTGVNTGSTEQPKFGFQVACIKGTAAETTPTDAGAWSAPPPYTHIEPPTTNTVLNIIEHSMALEPASGGGGNGTTYVESLSWTAPVTGTGAISFWAGLNAVNDNGEADIGDLWNVTNMAISEETRDDTTGISSLVQNDEIRIYPNPASDYFNLQWENAQAGNYIISIYNLGGQNITSQKIYMNRDATSYKINAAQWVPGIYLISLEKGDMNKIFRVVKQ